MGRTSDGADRNGVHAAVPGQKRRIRRSSDVRRFFRGKGSECPGKLLPLPQTNPIYTMEFEGTVYKIPRRPRCPTCRPSPRSLPTPLRPHRSTTCRSKRTQPKNSGLRIIEGRSFFRYLFIKNPDVHAHIRIHFSRSDYFAGAASGFSAVAVESAGAGST